MSGGRATELDGLRGVAAAGVVAFHAHPQLFFPLWSFVDLFFVLSGLLITGILLRIDLRSPRMVFNFWMRRVLRIWPVYFIALFGVLALWAAYAAHHGARPPFGHVWQAFVFMQYAEEYFLPNGVVQRQQDFIPLFDHSWSLAVEEQFYILWPLVLMLLLPDLRRLQRVALALFGLSALALAGGFFVQILLSRMGNLGLGALLALLVYRGPDVQPDSRRMALFVTGAFLLGFLLVAPYLVDGYRHGTYEHLGDVIFLTPWAAVVPGAGLIYFSLIGALLMGWMRWLARLLSLRPLVYLGSLSYALYMFHPPILFVLDQAFERWGIESLPAREAMLWATLLGVTALSRHLLENRMDRLKKHFPLDGAAPVAVSPATPVTP